MTGFEDIGRRPGSLVLSGCPEGFDSLVASDLIRREGVTVFIARDFSRMNAIADSLRFFAPDLDILPFPAWDCLPYDRMSPTPGIVAQRMYGLTRLLGLKDPPPSKPVMLLTTATAAGQKVPPVSAMAGGHLALKPGQTLDIAKLEEYFLGNGYNRVSTVADRGEFAIRGGLVDVFSPGQDEPVRLDFFGDSLESIRSFDPETQRSLKQVAALEFHTGI